MQIYKIEDIYNLKYLNIFNLNYKKYLVFTDFKTMYIILHI